MIRLAIVGNTLGVIAAAWLLPAGVLRILLTAGALIVGAVMAWLFWGVRRG